MVAGTQNAAEQGRFVFPSRVAARDERLAACALCGLPGVGRRALDLFRRDHGTLARALARGPRELSKTEGLHADEAASLASAADLVARGEWVLKTVERLGGRALLDSEPDYPELLRQASGPSLIYVIGTFADVRRVGIVGTRKPDAYGEARTRAVTERLVGAGIEIVSGGADGVDKVAHERALKLGGRTLAVVGTGFLHPFPSGHRELYERIAAAGAVVSEFAPDAGGQPGRFPQRNRTIAGLSEAVVLTRGAQNSGALSTCEAAKKAGRPVFAVPANVGEEYSAAPNRMLSEGARATLDGAEVLRALGVKVPETATEPTEPTEPTAPLPPERRRVLDALGPAPRHVDELAEAAQLSASATLAELLALELSGLCTARPGKLFLRR